MPKNEEQSTKESPEATPKPACWTSLKPKSTFRIKTWSGEWQEREPYKVSEEVIVGCP